jgi:pyridinium-3,5-biscarboxylic acid mononucleotide sulfurtransferase
MNMQEKEKRLNDWFGKHQKVLVALSGGVDSCLVAFMARKLLGKENAVSVVGVSPSLKGKDYQLTIDFCKQHDIKLVEINPNEIADPNYSSNPVNRCFFCKSNLYEEMHRLRAHEFPDFILVNGNNTTDWGDYRPGLKAADKYTAYSPLADCGFGKDDIRELAKYYNLSVWDKPASPCLSSRFPYGEHITEEKLKMVEQAENLLNDSGFSDVRVRIYNTKARIEVPKGEIGLLQERMKGLVPQMQGFGFTQCEIDQEGLVSGKMNRVLGK